MNSPAKANHVASTDREPVHLSPGATFIDGSPISADGGGIVVDDGNLYSVAATSMVPNGADAVHAETGWSVPANRAGRVTILEHPTSQPTTLGAELEHIRLDADGSYADREVDYLLKVNELYTFMGESGTRPTDDPAEFERLFWEMIHEQVDDAKQLGQYAGALAVFGQGAPGPDQMNPSIYVANVVGEMTGRTGFDTLSTFRTGSAQAHTGVSHTFAATLAAEAMQHLSPLLMSPTLAGPLLNRPPAGPFTAAQNEHMRRASVVPEDLQGDYLSWRYLLRRLGSPSAGIWATPPPDSLSGILQAGHADLAAKGINNIDRANGWHTDRMRMVLDGKGANTFEDCSTDTALGRVATLVPLQLLRGAIFTRLEGMAMEGRDPREAVARMLGTAGLSPQTRLDLAHHFSLREVSRKGNDAPTYLGKRPDQWLSALFQIADEAPHIRLTKQQRTDLAKTFATWADTKQALNQWCVEHGVDAPTPQAYFDLGLNNPAVYMRAQHEAIQRQHPDMSNASSVREVELSAAQALHRASEQERGM
jgi:hypothetical protein